MPKQKPNTKRPVVSLGVGKVRRPNRTTTEHRKRLVHGFTAAEAATEFKKGGSAFAEWLGRVHGIKLDTRMTEIEWAPLIKEFAERPIYGHRRGASGGNHRTT